MKKLMTMAGLILASTAFAQKWEVGNGNLTLVGCYGKQDGVYCDLTYTLTRKQTETTNWNPNDFKIFKQDGTSQNADAVAFIDGIFGNQYTGSSVKEIIANVPVKVQIYFNIPNSVSNFRALAYGDQKFDNIPVRAYGSASTSPTQLPEGPTVKGFAISLSNCQLQGQNYVCTATLTPNK